ncbi:MAG: hypothetical protein WDZ70_02555 [Candidatus Paceibacterota bacterium]
MNISKLQSIGTERAITFGLIAILAVASISYAYFVNKTVLHVVDRKDVEEEIALVSARIAEMEYEYMQTKATLTQEYAHTLGFKEVTNQHFVTRGSSDVVTFRE